MAKKKNLQFTRLRIVYGSLFTTKGSFLGSEIRYLGIFFMLIKARTSPTVHPLLRWYVRVTSPVLSTLIEPVPTRVALDVSHVGLSAPIQIAKPTVDGMS
jgi:hypothetical protein